MVRGSDKNRLSLRMGYCAMYPGGGCVFGKSECSDENAWRSSGEMIGAPYRAHGGYCLLAGTMRDTLLGRCGSGDCSPTSLGCGSEYSSFVELDKECSIENTKFGYCDSIEGSMPGFCAWSPEDCEDDISYVWKFPAEECTSDKVMVGGCLAEEETPYCAISADGCEENARYLKPQQLSRSTDYECFVGMSKVKPLGIESALEDLKEATVPIDDQSSPGLLLDSSTYGANGLKNPAPAASLSQDSESQGGTSPSLIIGIALGCVLLVALLAVIMLQNLRNKRMRSARDAEFLKQESVATTEQEDYPPSDLMIVNDYSDVVSDIGA